MWYGIRYTWYTRVYPGIPGIPGILRTGILNISIPYIRSINTFIPSNLGIDIILI